MSPLGRRLSWFEKRNFVRRIGTNNSGCGPREQSADDQPENNETRMFEKIQNPREIRLRLNLNQQEFWGQIGVTQSGGSRYESGRNMPKPVRELLRLVHVDQVDLKKINKGDVALISYLKLTQPALYRRLKSEASTRAPRRRARR
jgi:transcriptional regulator with XRE-family HTH domain